MLCSRSCFGALSFHAAVAALIFGGQAMAQVSDPRPAAAITPAMAGQSPFVGEWELDLTRMPETYGPPPKRVTFDFQDLGSGQWLTKVKITAPDDSVRQAAVRYRRDGRAVQSEGDMADADSAAFDAPAPNVLVMSMGKDKGLTSARVYVVSPDGMEMTESAASLTRDGLPLVRNFHFRRIR